MQSSWLHRWIIATLLLTMLPAALVGQPVRLAAAAPAAEPLISRNAPAYSNDACTDQLPADAVDDNYDTLWRSCQLQASTATPIWLALDLSSVPATQRQQVVVVWYNDPVTSPYDHTLISDLAYNLPQSYTIDVNSAPGGSVPTSGWTTLATVTGNHLHSRQHLLALNGANWVRISVTEVDGSSGNQDVALNLDVHDASQGTADDWIFYGDSITQEGLAHDSLAAAGGTGTWSQMLNATLPGRFPVQENGGIGGWRTNEGASQVPLWLPLFPGKYVVLAFGTNDASAEAGDANVGPDAQAHFSTMIQAVLSAGKVPIIPTIPYSTDANIAANGPVINQAIAAVIATNPGTLAGPDLWSFFKNHQPLLSSDGIHLTGAGYVALRQQWVSWAVANVYTTATTGAVSGKVTDATTGDPLAGASVSLDGTNVSTTTAGDGSYELTGVPPGNQNLTASLDGYLGQTQPVNVTVGATTVADFSLIAVPATKAISWVQGAATSPPAATNAPAVTLHGVAAGDTLVVALYVGAGDTETATGGVTSTGPTPLGWTMAASAIHGTTQVNIWLAPVTTAGDYLITGHTVQSSVNGITVDEYNGVSTTQPALAAVAGGGHGTTPSVTGVTTLPAGALVFGALGWDTGLPQVTAGSGFILRESFTNTSQNQPFAVEDQSLAADHLLGAVWALSESTSWTAAVIGLAPAAATQPPPPAPGLHVSGNQLLDASGNQLHLHGVNYSGSEYACIQGWGTFAGPTDQAAVDAMKSWSINAVRIPLNEDCWLGINGAPVAYSGPAYQQAIIGFVGLLLRNGIVPILELHWSAPGSTPATNQSNMPDSDNSVSFWRQVATTFKSQPNVVFDPFNEPYPDSNQDTTAAWTCWRDGGSCGVDFNGHAFQAAGMQSLVDAIRTTGAGNVIMLGGVQYANALSQWLAYEPSDPSGNLVAAWHVYNFNRCNSATCWNSTAAPVAQAVPLIASELGEDDGQTTMITSLLSWLDDHQAGYLAWAWDTLGSWQALIGDYDGAPWPGDGLAYHDYLQVHWTPVAPGSSPGSIAGRVTDAGSGAGLGGVTVSVEDTNLSTTTDSSGNYRIDNAPPGLDTVSAVAGTYAGQSQKVAVSPGETARASFSLQGVAATTGTVNGTVTDSGSGAGIAGAAVSVNGTALSTTTDAGGHFTLNGVPAGPQGLTVSADGYAGQSGSVTVPAGGSVDANFSLTPTTTTGSLAGRITSSRTGAPVTATVTVMMGTKIVKVVRSKSDGTYQIDGLGPGNYTVIAKNFWFRIGTAQVSIVAGQASTVNLALTSWIWWL